MAGADVRPFWLVLDIRSASSEHQSGLGRFVVGLAQALADSLSGRRVAQDAATLDVKLLLVAKSEPPKWAVQLVHEYPSLVSFWSGGPGALTDSWEKPQYLWSSKVLRRISRWSEGRFFWIAPCNFDRPILSKFLLPRHLRNSIVQVIHDTIPIEQRRSMSFFFWLQYSILVRRTLVRVENIFTVSPHSMRKLERLAPRRTKVIHVLPSGIETIFGVLPRFRGASEIESGRAAFIERLSAQSVSTKTGSNPEVSNSELEKMIRRRWVVGVGRTQKYKGWDVAEEALRQLSSDVSEGIIFIRVGGLSDGSGHKSAASQNATQTKVSFENCDGLSVLRIESLSDELLAQVYRCADLMVHPSRAEGFGFPPVEAALSGLPVIYRAGTAVDDHFNGHSFHPQYWQSVESDEASEWRTAILSVLRNKSGLDAFFDEMHSAVHPRAFICQRGGGQDFRWGRAAESMLNVLFAENQSELAIVGESQQ
jgi:glycosyltransferase involved in cell wall biosynthesis